MSFGKKKQILVIEDEPALNEAYKLILDNQGYDVLSAYNGEEALEILKQATPSLLLLDLRMPKLDGIGFLKKYKPVGKKPRIIIFSNFDMQKEIEQAYSLGADRYILKSWASPRELISIVKESLAA